MWTESRETGDRIMRNADKTVLILNCVLIYNTKMRERHDFAQLRSKSRKSIHRLANGLLRSVRAHSRRSPASLGFTHASEPGFILDHQNEGAVVTWFPLMKDLRDLRRIVFLKCSWVCGSALGCRERGMSLRQPCRSRSR